ncbi:MAG: ABC transporter ATP-binding protein [Geobacter sp.]|nr:ABC transporter ATP-binding protein [Geobacter sp.]
MSILLEIDNLKTSFNLPRGVLNAVDNVSLSVRRGETLAIVGESGCGKSMTAFSVMRLVPPPGQIAGGRIVLAGTDLLALSEEEMRKVRGNRIAMIFQEPMSSLNPVFRIGDQIAEGLVLHRRLTKEQALDETCKILRQVGIPSPADRMRDYPHQLSGGMRQRVMIAIAIACKPELLIADEPTTALDVTIQAQILELLDSLKRENDMGMMLITHDFGIVAEHSQSTSVMYAGRIVEAAPTPELLQNPLHPYTRGLLDSLPQRAVEGKPLKTIPGQVPDLLAPLEGCGFCVRCPDRQWRCSSETPPVTEFPGEHMVRCWKYA